MRHTRLGPWLMGAAAATLVMLTLVAQVRPASVQAADAGSDMAAVDTSYTRLLAVETAMVELANADRAAHGLPPLSFEPRLLEIARARAARQLEVDNLTHYDERGSLAFVVLLDQAGVRYGLAGENLARSSTMSPDVTRRIEDALMKSPLHRKNILETGFSRVAIGAATDANGRIAFAQIFSGD